MLVVTLALSCFKDENDFICRDRGMFFLFFFFSFFIDGCLCGFFFKCHLLVLLIKVCLFFFFFRVD